MDGGDPRAFQLFLEVYGTLARAGPGGDEYTLRALGLVPAPAPRTVLDLGCGPGAHTLCLARALPEARILGVDLLPEMVAETERRITEAGLGGRVRAEVGDMAEPPVAPASQDLVWCEAAIYNVGVTEALTAWRPLLVDGGTVVFSDLIWLSWDPPDEIRSWWEAEYPAMVDDAGVRGRIGAAGYDTSAGFVMPPSAWWDDYLGPMQVRVEELRARLPDDPAAIEVADAAEAEIDVFRRFSDHFAYAFYVVRPTH